MTEETTDKARKCKQCGQTFPSMSAVRLHQIAEHGSRSGPRRGNAYKSKFKPHCVKCNKWFKDLSNLRKHQWAEHPKMFSNLKKVAAESAKKRWAAKKGEVQIARPETVRGFLLDNGMQLEELAALNLPAVPQNGNHQFRDMPASQLLVKLKSQRDFMIDVVNFLEGILMVK